MWQLITILISTIVFTFIGICLEDGINNFIYRRSNRKRLTSKPNNYEKLMKQLATFNKTKVTAWHLLSENIIETKTISKTEDLKKELINIQTTNEIRLSFEPDPAFSHLEKFWLLKTPKKKGVYYLELNFKYPDGKTGLCGYNTYNFDEMEVMITNLIIHQKLPDISSWVMSIINNFKI